MSLKKNDEFKNKQQRYSSGKFRASAQVAGKRKNKWLIAIISLSIIIIISGGLLCKTLLPDIIKYNNAKEAAEIGDVITASKAFMELGDFRDAKEKALEVWNEVAQRDTLCVSGRHIAALKSDGAVVATGYNESGQCDVSDWSDIV